MPTVGLKIPQAGNIKSDHEYAPRHFRAPRFRVSEWVVIVIEAILLRIQQGIVARKQLKRMAAGIEFKPEGHIGMGIIGGEPRERLVIVDDKRGALGDFVP